MRVRLTLNASTELHNVVLDDPLPAGLEPVDTRLKVSSRQAQEVQQANRRGSVWRWPVWSHLEYGDHDTTLFASYVPKGTHEYVYLARATIAGVFRVRPTHGYEQYFPEVFARTDSRLLRVSPP